MFQSVGKQNKKITGRIEYIYILLDCLQDVLVIYMLYIYIYIYIYINLPLNAIVRLPYPRSGDSQGQETFLAPSVDKQTCNYDTECCSRHPSLPTSRSKG